MSEILVMLFFSIKEPVFNLLDYPVFVTCSNVTRQKVCYPCFFLYVALSG